MSSVAARVMLTEDARRGADVNPVMAVRTVCVGVAARDMAARDWAVPVTDCVAFVRVGVVVVRVGRVMTFALARGVTVVVVDRDTVLFGVVADVRAPSVPSRVVRSRPDDVAAGNAVPRCDDCDDGAVTDWPRCVVVGTVAAAWRRVAARAVSVASSAKAACNASGARQTAKISLIPFILYISMLANL